MIQIRESFVFYRSFWEILELLDDPAEWQELLRGVFEYIFDDKEPDFDDPALQIAFTHFRISCDSAAARYDKAIEGGKQGGRPSKWIEQQEAEKLFAELGNWKAVADRLEVDPKTLRKARYAWMKQEGEKRKNLSVSSSVSVSAALAVADTDIEDKITPCQTPAGPYGPPSVTSEPKRPTRWIPPPFPEPKR